MTTTIWQKNVLKIDDSLHDFTGVPLKGITKVAVQGRNVHLMSLEDVV